MGDQTRKLKKALSLRGLPQAVQDAIKQQWDCERDLREEITKDADCPAELQPYLRARRLAIRNDRRNPKLAEDWCEVAYELLYDVLEIPELAQLLKGGFPTGPHYIESLPGVQRQRETKQEIIASVLALYATEPTLFTESSDDRSVGAMPNEIDLLTMIRKFRL